ncbi:MAG: hypothetical protein ACRBB0_06760 [Pelagimonas sp.]|uniref:hypothetical protein n=1 Tax=Pelagimonas sp. TaxID=2073170 RepID=UPI003D6C4253
MRGVYLAAVAAFGMATFGLAGCMAPQAHQTVPQTMAFSQVDAEEIKIEDLSALIAGLNPSISAQEAAEIARIAVEDPLDWAREWDVVESPYFHNVSVNQGRKPRGLCKDWADDLEARMKREGFETVEWHRAIANHDSILIEHSTLIVSAKGADMTDGIVLDPWRIGQGQLFFSTVKKDPKYRWVERSEVFAFKRQRREARRSGG